MQELKFFTEGYFCTRAKKQIKNQNIKIKDKLIKTPKENKVLTELKGKVRGNSDSRNKNKKITKKNYH